MLLTLVHIGERLGVNDHVRLTLADHHADPRLIEQVAHHVTGPARRRGSVA